MKRVLLIAGSPSYWSAADSEPYQEAVRGAGAEPVVMLPDEGGPYFDGIAGLLLMGGDDVDPERYGQSRMPETEPPDVARDQAESAAIAEAIELDLPLLGICRGLQILNVHHGGTLLQHLPQRSIERHLRRTPDRSQPAHRVQILPGTTLSRVLAEQTGLEVNSRHHQAILGLGAKLTASAFDEGDGTIEAIERQDRRFCVAVQWHPENQWFTDPGQAGLFRAFAAALC
jgi:putative glutamine amidotransferase